MIKENEILEKEMASPQIRSPKRVMTFIFVTVCLFLGLVVLSAAFAVVINHTSLASILMFVLMLSFAIYSIVRLINRYPRFVADRNTRIFNVWWGFYFSLKRRSYSFYDIDFVEVTRETSYEDKRHPFVYPIKIHLKNDAYPTKVQVFTKHEEARKLAKKLAIFMNTKLQDIGQGIPVTQTNGELKQPLRSRLRTGSEFLKEQPTFLKSPPDSKIVYDINFSENTGTFIFPAKGFNTTFWNAVIVSIILIVLGIVPIIIFGKDLASTLIISLIGVTIFVISMHFSTLTQKIMITPENFTLKSKSWLKNKLEQINLAELDAFEVKTLEEPPVGNLLETANFVAVSDNKIITFAQPLSENQAKWLVDAVKCCISFDKNQIKPNQISKQFF